MSLVEVRDHALWTKHIRGNDPLKAEITELSAGCRIELEIDIHGGRPPTEQHCGTSPNEVDPAFAPRLCTEAPHEFLHLGSIRRFPHGIGVPR